MYRIAFPDSLKSIGKNAFRESLITTNDGYGLKYPKELVLPSSVTEIGEGAFSYLTDDRLYEVVDFSETQITILEKGVLQQVAACDILLPDTLQIIESNALEEAGRALSNGEVKSACRIPASVERIESEAFYSATINIFFEDASSLSYIGDRAFSWLKGQSTIELPEGLLEIGNKAFADAVTLSTLVVPSSVTSIGNDLCNRANVTLQVEAGSYGAIYASENGYITAGNEDTSWLNG